MIPTLFYDMNHKKKSLFPKFQLVPILCLQVMHDYMWHDQGEWVGCREYWFWATGLKGWQIIMFFIAFKLQRMFISPQPDVPLRWDSDSNVAAF